MLPDALLKDFVNALSARSDTKSRTAHVDWEKRGLPGDVGRLLSAVGGAAYGDLRFVELSELEEARELWDKLVTDFEAGQSSIGAHALWNPNWYPIAQSSVEVYAYDPIGCFRGRPGQIVGFDFKGGQSWGLFPSIGFWLAALKAGLEGAPEENAVYAARRWAEVRQKFCRVSLPETPDEQRSKHRFELPRSVVIDVADELERCDFTLLVLHALSRARKPHEVLGEIARALDAAVPYCNLQRLQNAELGDVEELSRAWLTPLLAKHAAKKGVSQLLFGIETRSNGIDLWMWPCAPGQEPSRSERAASRAPCFGQLYEIIDSPDVGFSSEAWDFIYASAAFLIRGLIDKCASRLPWGGELDVVLGRTLLGRCDADGFVPTPLPIASSQLQSARKQNVGGLKQMNFAGKLPNVHDHPLPADAWTDARRLRHPDGRAWEVVVNGDSWQCTTVESDGQRETFTRPIKTGWEVETLIAAQVRAGFVEL
jgi:hypothetical protein